MEREDPSTGGTTEFDDSDATLRTVLDSSTDNIMLVDRDHKILYINHVVADLTHEQVVGRPPYDFVPAFREQITECFERVIASGKPDRYETQYEAEDGRSSHWESRVFPVFRDKRVESMTVFSRNVTESLRQVAARERFFRLSTDLLCVAGLDGYLKRVNPAFSDVLGYDEQELLGKPLSEFVHPDDRKVIALEVTKLAAGEGPGDFEVRYIDKSGGQRWIYWRSVFDPEERVVYGVGRDMTERHVLEQRVLHSQKLDAVGLLAGGIAHDFNNLILGIMMNAELVGRQIADESMKFQISEIITAGKRARDLTRQLLAFSRSELFETEIADLADVVNGLLSMLRRLIPESIDIDILPSGEPCTVNIDRGQMEQVIVNLCLNARDAMRDGGRLSIYAGITEESDGTRKAMLSVADTGAGIDDETKAKIFDPFFTTKGPGTGSGLGLATVRTVVERHNGHVDFSSELGSGATFRVWLPLASGEGRPTVVKRGPDAPTVGGSETILVAEDDDLVRIAVVSVLENAGYVVIVASDGQEAISRLRGGQTFDVAILDLVMPQRSGHDVFLEIRKLAPAVPVVFTTGYSDGELPDAVLDQPNVRMVRKPYLPAELLGAVRGALDGD